MNDGDDTWPSTWTGPVPRVLLAPLPLVEALFDLLGGFICPGCDRFSDAWGRMNPWRVAGVERHYLLCVDCVTAELDADERDSRNQHIVDVLTDLDGRPVPQPLPV